MTTEAQTASATHENEVFHPTLSPMQETAYAELKHAVEHSALVLLEGSAGSGKTTLVKRLLSDVRGTRLTTRDLFSSSAGGAHAALDAPLMRLIEDALARHDLVVFEDFDTLHAILDGPAYVRYRFWAAGMRAMLELVRREGKRLVVTASELSSWSAPEFDKIPLLTERGARVAIGEPDAEEYRFHLNRALGETEPLGAEVIRHVYEHSPKLNPWQLQMLAGVIRTGGRRDVAFIKEALDKRIAQTNLRLREVEKIELEDLKGFEHIVAELTTHVINPLRADPRFAGLALRPKRGVLLYGPPGTGKTSVGRALAHRMKGKFFLIDGTVAADPASTFYGLVQWTFRQAKRAAPSVVFIDDADVLFQSDRATGLSRYLLTMLDGLESESAGKVAVILTAMNPNHLPPALLRSGRVELWLETSLPDETARAQMLEGYLKDAPEAFRTYDVRRAATLSEGFNAADIRRLVMDVKALYARDILADREPQSLGTFFDSAICNIRETRELLQQAMQKKIAVGV